MTGIPREVGRAFQDLFDFAAADNLAIGQVAKSATLGDAVDGFAARACKTMVLVAGLRRTGTGAPIILGRPVHAVWYKLSVAQVCARIGLDDMVVKDDRIPASAKISGTSAPPDLIRYRHRPAALQSARPETHGQGGPPGLEGGRAPRGTSGKAWQRTTWRQVYATLRFLLQCSPDF